MNKEILRLAIPNILSNISVPLLSTVDTALMGRMSEIHIGAVGLGAMIFNFVYWNFGFLRMGTTGMTAQAFGRKDESDMIQQLVRALLVGLVLAGLVLLLQKPLGELSFILMNVREGESNIYDLLAEYYYIRIWAAPATLGLYVLMGWFFGMQNAIYPLILTLVINMTNIVFSFIFIIHFGMEVDGVAWGTVIAQYIGLITGLILFLRKYPHLLPKFNQEALLQIDQLKRFFIINRDIFLRTFCLTFAFGFFYSQSSSGGDMVLAVNVILLQFLNWMSYGVDGFAFASESLVGKYTGAKDNNGLKKAIRLSFGWGFITAAFYSSIYLFLGEGLLRVFTDQQDVIAAASPYMFWMIIFPVISFSCYIWDGIFIGLTASVAMRDAMVISLILYLGMHYLLLPMGNDGMWLALLGFMAVRAVVQWIYFSRQKLLHHALNP